MERVPIRPGPKNVKAALVAMMKSSAPMIVLTENASRALASDFSSTEAATEWIHLLVRDYKKPLGVNLANYTTIISPSGWTAERLRGYVAVHAFEIESNFGAVVDIESAP